MLNLLNIDVDVDVDALNLLNIHVFYNKNAIKVIFDHFKLLFFLGIGVDKLFISLFWLIK